MSHEARRFRRGLRDEQAIERVPMMPRERLQGRRMGGQETENLDPATVDVDDGLRRVERFWVETELSLRDADETVGASPVGRAGPFSGSLARSPSSGDGRQRLPIFDDGSFADQ
jgi:hypothetical protein